MSKIEFRNVVFSTLNAKGQPVSILKEVSFAVGAGESLVILGPSGSGKSTVLRLCNRLADPDEGEVLLDGQPLKDQPVCEVRRRVGMVLQRPVFFKDMDLRDNLLYGITLGRKNPPDVDSQAESLLKQVGLSPSILDQSPQSLSAGQAQRLCLARTLATEPEVLLLDEPTSALDPSAKLDIERLIAGLLHDQGRTTIFVTHDLEQARRMGGKGAILVDGQIVESGEIADLLDHPKEELSRRFVTGNLSGD